MTEGPGPVLVTGTSSGIGRRIVETLSEQGHAVFAAVRKEADQAPLAALPNVTPILLDVTHDDSVRASARMVREAGRGLYGLVNNAGTVDLAPLLDTSIEDLSRLLDVNVYGMHRMVRACFPLLRQAHGRIVNIGSINGVYPDIFEGSYCMSKYAVEAYTDVLREEFAPLGIGVSVVEPGGFRSNIVSSFFERKKGHTAAASVSSPMREATQKFFSETFSVPGELDRSRYPDSRPVAEAVVDALFSQTPKTRYLVGSTGETSAAIDQVIRLLVQLNERHNHSLTADELVARLRAALQ
ncbi:MAG TPA: SDR family oxidoreductase [Thermoplasmata archaeon]|jgi:NAD(P)-dependent dehydrogenase (short-subunit alcohol dehydrogenase family)|nr:SDR family oxidoreductase [Thermoplasmata archaeon]HYB78680.1 SDR family oxidoreductase [Thermoplasmata archaeon]